MNEKQADQVISALDAIKKLVVLQLLEKGYSQQQLALTLGIGQASISRMFPAGVLKKRKKAKDVEAN